MSREGEQRAVHVRISGRVQGVGFRAWVEQQAGLLGLSGWVRNLQGGDVEAVFSGTSDRVDAMLAACREGPRHAQVANVEILGAAEPYSGPFSVWGSP